MDPKRDPKATKQQARKTMRSPTAIAESEEWLFTTLQSIGDAVIATDAEGHVVFMNTMAERLTGWTAAQAQGKDCREVFHIVNERTRLETESPVTKVLRGGRIAGLANHTILIAKDGTERSIDDSGSPIRNRAEELTGVVLIFRDVSGRRAAERTLQEQNDILQTLFDHIPILAAFFDNEGRFRWVNAEWVRVTGWTLAEMLELPVSDEFGPRREEPTEAIVANSKRVPRWRDVETTLDDGRPLTVTWATVPLSDGTTIGIGYDVTRRRLADRERSARDAAIAEQNARLLRAVTETNHRVKNNLQTLSALVDLELMDYPTAVPVDRLADLRLHICTLASIHDLLTAAARRGAVPDRLSARETLEQLVPMLKATATVERLDLSADDVNLPVGYGMLVALLANELVTNAAKHGGRNVALTFAVGEGTAAMQVSDDGPGFPQPFDPVDQANAGLQLVERMARWDLRGETSYMNRPEGGGCVRITFPVPLVDRPA